MTRVGHPANERPPRPVEIDYPGVGTKRVWTFGHPEAITLPREFPGVHTPESLLDPASYFAALAPHCLSKPKPGEIVASTRSWDAAPKQAIEAALTAARASLNGGSA